MKTYKKFLFDLISFFFVFHCKLFLVFADNLPLRQETVNVNNDTIPSDFGLGINSYNYNLEEDMTIPFNHSKTLISLPSSLSILLPSDVFFHVMKFLYSTSTSESINTENIVHVLQINKFFYHHGHQYIEHHLKFINTPLRRFHKSVSVALFKALPQRILDVNLRRLKEHFVRINLNDLVEILMAIHFKSNDVILKRSLLHLFKMSNISNLHELDPFKQSNWELWILRAFDRVFRYNPLPYAGEMYLKFGKVRQVDFFLGICEVSLLNTEGTLTLKLLERFLEIEPKFPLAQLISMSVTKGTVYLVELILSQVIDETESSLFSSPDNIFLEVLINRKLFSTKLFELCRHNYIAMEKALEISFKTRQLEIFLFLLNHLDLLMLNQKWSGCLYILTRTEIGNENILGFDSEYFQKTFLLSHQINNSEIDHNLNYDIYMFPLLMPNFNLNSQVFFDIFQILINFPEFNFTQPQPISKSLIFSCVQSEINFYLESIPLGFSYFAIGLKNRLNHVTNCHLISDFSNKSLSKRQVEILISRSTNPLDLLYFIETFDNVQLFMSISYHQQSNSIFHNFPINEHFNLSLSQIDLKLDMSSEFENLRSVPYVWNLLQLAVVYKKFSLIEILVNDQKFDKSQLNFVVANQFRAIDLAVKLENWYSQSPCNFLVSYEMNRVVTLLKDF